MTREEIQARINEYQQLARMHGEQAQYHAEQQQRAIGGIAALTDVLKSLEKEMENAD